MRDASPEEVEIIASIAIRFSLILRDILITSEDKGIGIDDMIWMWNEARDIAVEEVRKWNIDRMEVN